MAAPAAKRRLRVMTMVDGLHGGGESVAAQLALGVDRERFEVSYCVTRWADGAANEAARERLVGAGIEFIGLRRERRLAVGEWRRLVRFMREREIEILHAHKFGSNFWGAVLAPVAQVPVFVAHEHTWSFEGQRLRRLIDRALIARRADAFIAVSEQDRRKMAEVERIPEAKLRLIPNGIPDLPQPSGNDVRAELGLPPSSFVAGAVATLRRQKALEVLVRAAASLRARLPDVRVLIVGGEDPVEPDVLPRLKELVTDLRLEGTVVFAGARADIPDVLAALDAGVLSSDFEGAPLSVLEYMDAGLPVVATRVGGVPDLVEDGETGYLVPPRDPEALAAALERLASDPDRARAMGASGGRRRRAEFGLGAMVARIQALYEELLADKDRSV